MSKDKSGNWFKKHKILTVIGVIFLILVVSSSASGDKKSGSNSNTNNTSASDKAKVAKLNETVRDGKFEFTVKSVKCGNPSVTDSSGYVTKTAQGQYCFMDVTVKNIGDEQQYFSESDQKLFNSDGLQYSSDTSATITKANNSDVYLAQINPGNSVEGILVFDIPKDQTPTSAELHDSAFSNGVKVNL